MKNLQELVSSDKYDIAGRCPSHKGQIIKSLVEQSNAKLCVEIGVFKGASLLYFAEALRLNKGKIIGIDPYQIDAFKNKIEYEYANNIIYNILFTEQKILDDIYENLIKTIKNNDLSGVVSIIRDKSENYCHNIKNESLDILHIDGNHDEEYVSKDIINYLPLVKKNGYIIMDDINWSGVKNSINNYLINQCKLIKDYVEWAIYIKN